MISAEARFQTEGGGAAGPNRRQLGREPTAQVVKSSDGLPSNFARVASSISLPPSPTTATAAAICGPNEAVKKLSFTHEWAAPQGTTAKHFTNRESAQASRVAQSFGFFAMQCDFQLH